MAGAPGPVGLAENGPAIDGGTNARAASPVPAPAGATATAADAAPKTENDPAIEALDLTETARKAAYALKKAHASVVFTSGRRDKADQARAMAGNVVENRDWIEETYAKTDLRDKCQKWVDDNPEKKTKDEIAAGLESVLDAATDAQLGTLSKHLSGEAFDVQPVENDADAIKKAMRALEGLGKFLESEGGLVRWHAQF